MSASAPSDYRLAPALGARLVGTLLVLLAVLLFAATALVAVLHLSFDIVVVLAVVGVVAVLGLGLVLTRRTVVVRLDDDGYRVRWIRGAGVSAASWGEVEEVVAATPRGLDCLVLQLSGGRATTIPVAAVAGDKDDLARAVRDRIQRAQQRPPR